ncbi:energy transducer TonB [Pontibacter roseus]|uniref:energy transducer TonB n=1 Tax=Pontibacter roseus TaxID=336989 RepID=UPI0003665E55|nr:energy transducer TonB [Pontibacter roseus]
MKILCIVLLLYAAICSASAQGTAEPGPKTKKAKERLKEYTLDYHVLQENPGIMHGLYQMQGKTWACKGEYALGKRSGVWSFYGWNGKLEYQFDFTSNHEVFSDRKTDTLDFEAKVYLDGQYVRKKVDSRAFYFGGDVRILEFLAQHMKYPAEAKREEAEGIAIISVEISETGKMENMEVAKGLDFGMQEEALRVVSLLPGEWVPAIMGGKPVRSKHYIPVRFVL